MGRIGGNALSTAAGKCQMRADLCAELPCNFGKRSDVEVCDELACQLHELGRAGPDHHSADHPRPVRRKEVARTRPWNGPSRQGIPKGEGRVQRRAE